MDKTIDTGAPAPSRAAPTALLDLLVAVKALLACDHSHGVMLRDTQGELWYVCGDCGGKLAWADRLADAPYSGPNGVELLRIQAQVELSDGSTVLEATTVAAAVLVNAAHAEPAKTAAPPSWQEAARVAVDRRVCQACRLYDDHAHCTGENTLGTGRCECACLATTGGQ